MEEIKEEVNERHAGSQGTGELCLRELKEKVNENVFQFKSALIIEHSASDRWMLIDPAL